MCFIFENFLLVKKKSLYEKQKKNFDFYVVVERSNKNAKNSLG